MEIKDFGTTTTTVPTVAPKKQSVEDNYDELYDDDLEDKSDSDDKEVVRDLIHHCQ